MNPYNCIWNTSLYFRPSSDFRPTILISAIKPILGFHKYRWSKTKWRVSSGPRSPTVAHSIFDFLTGDRRRTFRPQRTLTCCHCTSTPVHVPIDTYTVYAVCCRRSRCERVKGMAMGTRQSERLSLHPVPCLAAAAARLAAHCRSHACPFLRLQCCRYTCTCACTVVNWLITIGPDGGP